MKYKSRIIKTSRIKIKIWKYENKNMKYKSRIIKTSRLKIKILKCKYEI